MTNVLLAPEGQQHTTHRDARVDSLRVESLRRANYSLSNVNTVSYYFYLFLFLNWSFKSCSP